MADFRLELQYTEMYDLYQLFAIDTNMAVTKYSNLPNY